MSFGEWEQRYNSERQNALNRLALAGVLTTRAPVWRDGAFSGLFGDAFIENTSLEGGLITPSLLVTEYVKIRNESKKGRRKESNNNIYYILVIFYISHLCIHYFFFSYRRYLLGRIVENQKHWLRGFDEKAMNIIKKVQQTLRTASSFSKHVRKQHEGPLFKSHNCMLYYQ